MSPISLSRHVRTRRAAALGFAGALLAALGPLGTAAPAAAAAPGCTRTVVAAGDMNAFPQTVATGRLAVSLRPNIVAPLGDLQYPEGSLADFRRQYARTGWGALKAKTRPVPGNHEYRTRGARGYFDFFPGVRPWYAYDMGCGWRGYALNSEVSINTQARWLRADLAAHPRARVFATWHRPRWSSGTDHGSSSKTQPFWAQLAGRRGVVLNGHEHNYERFAPRGAMRQFVVGTGGSSDYPFSRTPERGSVKRITNTPGVIAMTLNPGGYGWRFISTSRAVRDSGRG